MTLVIVCFLKFLVLILVYFNVTKKIMPRILMDSINNVMYQSV
jgi:hypothetical protein